MSANVQNVKVNRCDSWCRTASGNTVKHTFMWTIENFLERPEKREEDSIESTVFSVTGPGDMITNWYLELYPKGQDPEPGDDSHDLPVNLYNKDDFDIKAKAILSILDSSGKEQNIYSLDTHIYESDPDDGWGGRIAEIDKLRRDSNTLLPDGNLTILCKLEVFSQDELYSGSMESFNKTQINDECQKQVIDHLDNLFAEKNFSDMEITCDEEVFYCHRYILAARSPVFSAMFQADMIENHLQKVNIRDVKKEVFSEVLKFIYTGKVSSDGSLKDKARDILAVANKYQLELLKKLCEGELVSTLDASNCVELLVLGDLHQATNLKMMALDSVSMNLASLIETDVYKHFRKQHPDLEFEVTKSIVLKKGSSILEASSNNNN